MGLVRRRALFNWIALALVAAFGWPWPQPAGPSDSPRPGERASVLRARPGSTRGGGRVRKVGGLSGVLPAALSPDNEEDPDRLKPGFPSGAPAHGHRHRFRPTFGVAAEFGPTGRPRSPNRDGAVRLRC